MVSLVAETLELVANPEALAQGTVVEGELDRRRGAVATVLVQAGTLKQGDVMVVGPHFGRVRSMMDDLGNPVKEAGPSVAVQVFGLGGVPSAGTVFKVTRARTTRRFAFRLRGDSCLSDASHVVRVDATPTGRRVGGAWSAGNAGRGVPQVMESETEARREAEAAQAKERDERLASQLGQSMVSLSSLATYDDDTDVIQRINVVLRVSRPAQPRCLRESTAPTRQRRHRGKPRLPLPMPAAPQCFPRLLNAPHRTPSPSTLFPHLDAPVAGRCERHGRGHQGGAGPAPSGQGAATIPARVTGGAHRVGHRPRRHQVSRTSDIGRATHRASPSAPPRGRGVTCMFCTGADGGSDEASLSGRCRSEALVLGFNTTPSESVQAKAKATGVEIWTYDIIYALIDDVRARMEGKLKAVEERQAVGMAKVRDVRQTVGMAMVGDARLVADRPCLTDNLLCCAWRLPRLPHAWPGIAGQGGVRRRVGRARGGRGGDGGIAAQGGPGGGA